jgi:hypothetical protein
MPKIVRNACYGGFGFSNYAKLWFETRGVNDPYSLPRHHSLLVECVETLGNEVNSRNSALVIETVKQLYRLEEYDGYETVITPEDKQPAWLDATILA